MHEFKAEVSANLFFCPDFLTGVFLRTTGFKSRSGTTFRAVFTFLEWAENGSDKISQHLDQIADVAFSVVGNLV